MKLIHYLLPLGLVVCSCIPVHAQDYKIPVQNAKEGKLTLNDFAGNLPIEGYNGTEIIITSDRPSSTPSRAKGLQPLYAGGTDNTGMAVSMEKNGNQITLQCLLPITQSANYKIKVPDNFSIKVINECGHSGDVHVSDIKGEVEIKNCQSINLKNVSGPLVLSAISGDIEVVLTEISKDKPVSIAAISGEVDVTLPEKAAVDVEMEDISGGIYSDFDFNTDKKSLKRVGGNSKVKGQLNGGGADIKITNISGNIYLRKKTA